MKYQAHVETLEQGRWFHGLPPSVKVELLEIATLKQCASGRRLFKRGDFNNGLYCVLDGAVEIGSVDHSGRESLLVVVQPALWFGEFSFFDEGPRTHDAHTRGATNLLVISPADLKDLLQREPVIWHFLGALMLEKLRAVYAGTEGTGITGAQVRVAKRLLALTDGHNQLRFARPSLAVNQHQLGAMLGLTRQTVSETLRAFEVEGIVSRRYAGIDVLDLQKLRAVARSA